MKQYLEVKIAKPDQKLTDFLKKTKKELDGFFDSNIPEPVIFLLNSRQELDLIWQRKTEKWMVGGTKNGAIFILHPRVYVKESSHKNKNDFWKTLKHEYCHIYFRQITEGVFPLWLHEGLASYLADQPKTCNNPLEVFSYFTKPGPDLYNVGYFWVKLLIDKFGQKKFLQLIKSLKPKPTITEQIFSKRFYQVYGFKFNKSTLTRVLKQQ